MKSSLLLLFFLSFTCIFSQSKKEETAEIHKFQKELNELYLDKEKSPLRGEDFTKFKAHPFFPINLKYRVKAQLIKTENPQPFDIPTSSGQTREYREYGKAHFTIDGKPYVLTVYQNLKLIQQEEYRNHLFLPFHDATNGEETYGGGKYLDLEIPEGNEIIIDFNQSYQPYCAYTAYGYSCPIVPQENSLPIRIPAGVKALKSK